MATKNEENWLSNYESLKQWTLEHGHFPNRAKVEGRELLNWYKYNSKLIKQGKLSAEREQMIHELEEMRSGCHTGGAARWRTMTIQLRLRCADATMTMTLPSMPVTLAHGLIEWVVFSRAEGE